MGERSWLNGGPQKDPGVDAVIAAAGLDEVQKGITQFHHLP